MAKSVRFTRGAAERIADVVRRVENDPLDTESRRDQITGTFNPYPVYIWTTALAVSGEYAFAQIRRTSAGTAWEAMPDGFTSVTAGKLARDAKGATGLPVNTIGLLRPVIDGATPQDMRMVFVRFDSTDKYLARITGNASLASSSVAVGGGGSVTVEYKWKYAFTEVERDGSGVADVSSGRTGTTSGTGTTIYAINLAEVNHSGTYSWGVDITGASYPTGFRPRPIGGGGTANTHRYDRVVEMIEVIDKNGNMVRHFSATSGHDGDCA